MLFRNHVISVLLILISVLPATSQELTQTLRGRVIDAFTDLPLPGATIVILDSNPLRGTATDLDGNFRLDKIPVGRLSIEASMMGYKSVTMHNLLVQSGRELVVEIKLQEQVFALEDVVIKPDFRKDRAINEMAIVSARSFTVDETERYAGSLGDPSRMATNFAGVSSVSDQRNDIIIRGNSPLGLLWRLEGVEIPNPNHFGSLGSTGGPISMLNNNLLANSDFYTAAFPSEYGNALAGAFDLRMRNGNSQKHEFLGQVGFNGFELGAEGPFSNRKRSSYLANFRYSTLEVLQKAGMSFGTGAAIPQYKDLSFKLNFPLKKGRLSVFGLGGDNSIAMLDSQGDDAQYGFSGTDLYYNNRMGVIGFNHVHFLEKESRITSNFSITGIQGTVDIYDLSSESIQQTIRENLWEVKYSLSSKYVKRFNARNFISTGIVADLFEVNYQGDAYNENKDQYFHYLRSMGNTSSLRLFADWQHRFSDELSLNTGLHASWLFLNDSYAAEPRVGLKWEFTPGRSLNLGAGIHSQTQMKGVYFSQRLTDTLALHYEKTNENLDLSKSLHLVAGYDHLLGEGHRLKAEVYYQKLYNIPVAWRRPEFSLLSQGGAFSFWLFDNMENKGIGENKGIELTLEKFLQEGFYYLITASVYDAGYRGYDGVWRNSAFNNNFVVNALTGYEWKLGRSSLLSVDLKMVYAGGNRFLEIDEERSLADNAARYKWDEAYSKRYPDYFRLNGRITWRLNRSNINHEWALDLQNMTNQKNIFTQTWNSQKQVISTAYQMSFMPMMTYRVYF